MTEFEQCVPAVLAAAKTAWDQAWKEGHSAGVEEGYAIGMDIGQAIGFVAGIRSVQAAISDGLRHGSSECGKALVSLKNLGAISVDAEVDAHLKAMFNQINT